MYKGKFRFYALKLSGIIILIFLAQLIIPGFTELFVLDNRAYLEIWRFVTSIFLHGGAGHLLYNLFALAFFGSIFERLVGEKRFLLVFFVTGILANILSLFFYSSALGASGAIFGVIGALIVVRPSLPVWAFGLPMPIFVAGFIWAIGDIIGAYGFLSGNPINNTGNFAHLFGMFFGFLFGFGFRTKKIRKRGPGILITNEQIRNWEDSYLKS